MGLTDMYNAFKSLQMEIETVKAIDQTRSQAVQLNKEQLYFDGIKSDGINLRGYDSTSYATFKHELNPEVGYGRADLFLTGSFQGHMFAKLEGSKLVFGSTDFKTGRLEKRDGVNIFGLTENNKTNYAVDVVRPKVIDNLEKVTGLKAT